MRKRPRGTVRLSSRFLPPSLAPGQTAVSLPFASLAPDPSRVPLRPRFVVIPRGNRAAGGADFSEAAPGQRELAVHYFPILRQRRGTKDAGQGERERDSIGSRTVEFPSRGKRREGRGRGEEREREGEGGGGLNGPEGHVVSGFEIP